MSLPVVLVFSHSKDVFVSPPEINTIGVGSMTDFVPERPQEFSGTVLWPGILVYVESAKLLPAVLS